MQENANRKLDLLKKSFKRLRFIFAGIGINFSEIKDKRYKAIANTSPIY